MLKNLVIVESPAKAQTIEKFLGKDYKVMSSYGHIRDLKSKEFSIDLETFSPEYVIPEDKSEIVKKLKSLAQEAETVWLASDEDREGEAISWHLYEVLALTPEKTKRIVFHEITKSAILNAIETPRHIDYNLVNAQQARRVLDRIVGFKLSPVLWKKIKPSLSAGRVQSVAVRLIVEREREIESFTPEGSYRVTGLFTVTTKSGTTETMYAELSSRFKTEEEAKAFLEKCRHATFTVADISKRPLKKSPAAPFTTSTLQQEAARKLGFTVSQTMLVAQNLYEAGHITYMRTDSVNLSSLCLSTSRDEIISSMGEQYLHTRQFHTTAKGAQEAHEAIRPTYIDKKTIEGNVQQRRLYDLIWKRTIASQMADAELEKTVVSIDIEGETLQFISSGQVVVFDGFLRVYRESHDDENELDDDNNILPAVEVGDNLVYDNIVASEKFTQHPPRYTEASLVRKMEELGIGRPSTYAPTISTIQQREYVSKGEKKGLERKCVTITLADDKIKTQKKTEKYGAEKGKLLPTDIGTVVVDFLMAHFPEIMDYNFTAKVERDFDEIAEGKENWKDSMHDFYDRFEPQVEETMQLKEKHKVGERLLGTDPKTGRQVFAKIGRYGPVIQIGTVDDEEKPLFAQMKKGQSLTDITLEEALDLFALPRELGNYKGEPVTVGVSKFGPYVRYAKQYISIPEQYNPLDITLEQSVVLIDQRRLQDKKKHIKTFEEEPELEILNGIYGPYIAYKGSNYKIPKSSAEPSTLTLEQCMEIIEKQAKKPASTKKRKNTKK